MTSSKNTAILIIAEIQAADGVRTKQICHALGITVDQFRAATPYIKADCELIKLNWRMKP
jgi:hypothetical protein